MSTMELCYDAAVVASTREHRLRRRRQAAESIAPRRESEVGEGMVGWHVRVSVSAERGCRRCRRLRRPRIWVGMCCGSSESHLLTSSPCASAACSVSALNDCNKWATVVFINAGRTSPARRRNRQDVSCRRKAVAANYFWLRLGKHHCDDLGSALGLGNCFIRHETRTPEDATRNLHLGRY
jgi:hypothetical protein